MPRGGAREGLRDPAGTPPVSALLRAGHQPAASPGQLCLFVVSEAQAFQRVAVEMQQVSKGREVVRIAALFQPLAVWRARFTASCTLVMCRGALPCPGSIRCASSSGRCQARQSAGCRSIKLDAEHLILRDGTAQRRIGLHVAMRTARAGRSTTAGFRQCRCSSVAIVTSSTFFEVLAPERHSCIVRGTLTRRISCSVHPSIACGLPS